MPICKYFIEGYCKYGSRCKFDHDYNPTRSSDFASNDRPIGTSILKGETASFGYKEYGQIPQEQHYSQRQEQHYSQRQEQHYSQRVQPGLKLNVQDVMQNILKDVLQAEKGNQWQLSCYGPVKELANIPGLEDHSPEELRWECYKALQNGTLPLWQVIVQQLCTNVCKINNDLKKKDVGYSIIDRWLREGEEKYVSNQTSPFGTLPDRSDSAAYFQMPPGNQPHSINAFSFTLPQQQAVSAEMHPLSGSAFPSNQASVFPPPNQSSQQFSPRDDLVDNNGYSVETELSDVQLEAFKRDQFVFGNIPTKPPPKNLCIL